MPRLKKQSHGVKKAKDKQRKKTPIQSKKFIKFKSQTTTKENLDLTDIVTTGALITDDVICRVLHLLREKWPTINIGFRLPSEIEVLRNTLVVPPSLIPVDVHAVNIHYLDLHWVTSWQDPCDLSIKVYDSLYDHNRLIRLLPVLGLMYDLQVYTPKYITGISQQTEASCGAFASAFAVCCASHNPPERYIFTSDADMRQHLMHCIANGAISMFPAVSCIPHTKNETCTFIRTMREIELQKQLNRKKKLDNQKQNMIQNIKCRGGVTTRKNESVDSRKEKMAKDKERHRQYRAQETEFQRAKRLKIERDRQTKSRENESVIEKEERQKIDKERHIKRRDQETSIAKEKRQKVDKERHTKQRDEEKSTEKEKRQKVDKERHTKQRDHETSTEKEKRQIMQMDRQKKCRKQESDIEKEKRQKVDKERHTKQRDEEKSTEKEKRQKVDKGRHTKQRDQETSTEKEKRRTMQMDRQKKFREQESDIEKEKRQKVDEERHTKQRDEEKGIAKEKRQKVDKERHTKQRDQETSTEKEKRRTMQMDRQKKCREQENDIEKEKRQKVDKERHKKQRDEEKSTEKEKRQKVDKERHTKQRDQETSTEKEKRRTMQKDRQKKCRKKENDIEKEKRQKVDKERHTKWRDQEKSIAKEKRQKVDKERHTIQRDQETSIVKEKRQKVDKERHTKWRDQEKSTEKEKRQKVDKERHTIQRDQETSIVKEKRQKVDKERHTKWRDQEKSIAKEKRQTVDKERHTKQRDQETNVVKDKRQKVDKERHTKQRDHETSTEKEKRQKVDKERHIKLRFPQSLEKARRNFLNEIKRSPEYACSVCHRMMYKENSTELKMSNFTNTDLVNGCRTNLRTVSNKEWICKTCLRHLKRSSIPPQAQVNKMSLFEEGCILDELTGFESRLLAKRIPFMKITALPRGKQKGIIGSVINVPADVDETCELLPRTPNSAGIIPVKLKRKQEYKNHVFYEHVRPNKVLEAFQWLKQNNIHYKQVIDASELWEKTFEEEDNELYNHLTQPKLPDEDKTIFISVDENCNNDDLSDNDKTDNTEYEESEKEQPLDTCVQTSDLVLDASKVMNFSPGEGKTPVGFMMDRGCEERAFPKLFPLGKFGFDAQRETVITPKKYFNARILNKSGKFARDTEYLFFAQFVTEFKQVMDNISIAVRKSYSRTETGEVINSSMLQNPETLSSLITKDHAYQFLQTVRGSPPYWQKAMYKLLAAVKQFGIFKFFVTLSSADLKWHDTLQAISKQQGKPLSTEEVNIMSYEEKSSLLRSNPVTAARHFDHRLVFSGNSSFLLLNR